MQLSKLSLRGRVALSLGVVVLAAVLFSTFALTASPAEFDKLEQLDKDIETAWTAKNYKKAQELFTEWFTLTEKIQKEESGNPALAEWATEMQKWSKDLNLEADYQKLDTLFQSMTEAGEKGQTESAKRLAEESVALAESIKQRDSKNPEITQLITVLEESKQTFTSESEWKQLEEKDKEIAKTWAQGDLTTALKLVDEWFTIANKMKEDAELLKWKADMKNVRVQLENEIKTDALWRQLDAKDKEAAQAWEKGDLDKSKKLFTEWFTSAEELRKLLPIKERETLDKWIEDMRSWFKQLDAEFTISSKWKVLEAKDQDISKAWNTAEYSQALEFFDQWFTSAEDLKKLLPLDQKPDLEKWVTDMQKSKKDLEAEIEASKKG